MVQFVQNLSGYMRYDVIEPCWTDFVKSVEQAADFDVNAFSAENRLFHRF
jgi:hypothetical protein